jgi:UDP-N-acetylmuramoylalanine--D-glutamate ligase
MAAILACFASLEPRTSADFEKIIAAVNSVAREFGGVPHRLEFVAELNGVKYFNSSIDTSPARTIAALGVFDCPLVLICGGKSKGVPYDEAFAAAVFDKTRAVILTGETADMIEKSLTDYAAKFGDRPKLEIFRRENYNEVVSLAKKIARPGDAVLLSPASTSFDRFKNFEERGELFRRLVLEK